MSYRIKIHFKNIKDDTEVLDSIADIEQQFKQKFFFNKYLENIKDIYGGLTEQGFEFSSIINNMFTINFIYYKNLNLLGVIDNGICGFGELLKEHHGPYIEFLSNIENYDFKNWNKFSIFNDIYNEVMNISDEFIKEYASCEDSQKYKQTVAYYRVFDLLHVDELYSESASRDFGFQMYSINVLNNPFDYANVYNYFKILCKKEVK